MILSFPSSKKNFYDFFLFFVDFVYPQHQTWIFRKVRETTCKFYEIHIKKFTNSKTIEKYRSNEKHTVKIWFGLSLVFF